MLTFHWLTYIGRMVMELIDWQGHLAIFNGNKNTRPIEVIKGGFEDISERLAPSAGPMVSSDKQLSLIHI